jgi:hypothetical protein
MATVLRPTVRNKLVITPVHIASPTANGKFESVEGLPRRGFVLVLVVVLVLESGRAE